MYKDIYVHLAAFPEIIYKQGEMSNHENASLQIDLSGSCYSNQIQQYFPEDLFYNNSSDCDNREPVE